MGPDPVEAFAGAVAHLNCSTAGCTTRPAPGSEHCVKHRDMTANAAFGEPCERCGSRNWVRTPDAASVAWCAHCEYVTYDEDVFEASW